jgi:hypothetical protein
MTFEQFIEKYGLSLTLDGPPVGAVDASDGKPMKWPHIAYKLVLSNRDGHKLRTPWRAGVGHVKPTTAPPRLTIDEDQMFHAWKLKPSAGFRDVAVWASLAGKLAAWNKVAPDLADVLDSLASSVRIWRDGTSFREFASDFGYDQDSIKALRVYHRVCREGRRVYRWLGDDAACEMMDCDPR